MIPALPGTTANYANGTKPDGKPFRMTTEVVAWNDDGDPLMINGRGYLEIVPDEQRYVVSEPATGVIPGGGFVVHYCNTETGERWTAPVVAWRIYAEDGGVALVQTEEGAYSLEDVTFIKGHSVVVLPEGEEPK